MALKWLCQNTIKTKINYARLAEDLYWFLKVELVIMILNLLSTAVDRRFNIMITSSTFEELIYHLRHLLTLLKTKSSETKINYARLAEDLYWFLKDYQESVRLNWARQYYKQDNKGEQQNEN